MYWLVVFIFCLTFCVLLYDFHSNIIIIRQEIVGMRSNHVDCMFYIMLYDCHNYCGVFFVVCFVSVKSLFFSSVY